MSKKAFHSFTTVAGKEALLRKMVCEVRYQDGQLYLDRTGRLLRGILDRSGEWIIAPAPTTQGTSLLNVVSDSKLAFSMESASLSIDRTSGDEFIQQEEADAFARQADDLLPLITDEFEIQVLTRVGYREQYYFAFESKEDSEAWIAGLELVQVDRSLYGAFGGTLDALGVSLSMEAETCRYRIALNGVERSAVVSVGDTSLAVRTSATFGHQQEALVQRLKQERQRQANSAFAVVLDIDAFLFEPSLEFDFGAFVKFHLENNMKRFREALAGRGKKGG